MSETREQALMGRLVALKEKGRRVRFFAGLSLPLQAIRTFLGHPRLLVWAIVPGIINLVLFVLAVVLLVWKGGGVLDAVWARPEVLVWHSWLWVSLWWIVFGVLLAVGIVLSYFFVLLVGGVIASPFNDALSKRVELALTGEVVEEGGANWLGSVLDSLRGVLVYLLVMVPLFGLNLIPGVGSLVYSVLAPVVSSFFLVLDHSGSPLDRRGYGFGEKVRLVVRHRDFSAGFGVGSGTLMLVPVLNLVAMPILVVAGTIAGLSLQSWVED